jgi:cysteinyl-tRNA synthetase
MPPGLLALAALLFGAVVPLLAESRPPSPVKSWAYQLQDVDPSVIAASPYDLVVIDYGFDKDYAAAFPREIVDLMRRKPDGSARLVLAYMSIGEAEDYRYYWQDAWRKTRPEWIEPENPDWPGNYLVQYWRPQWQSIILGNPNAYLDRIIDAGFDGAYLDGVDRYAPWQLRRRFAASDMVALIGKIAAYARGRKSGFRIIPQNADELLTYPGMVDAIDGFAREELLYGEHDDDARNSDRAVADAVGRLRRVSREGKPVLVVEYTKDSKRAASALRELNAMGFVGYIAESRELNRLSPPAFGCGQPDCSR